MTSDLRALDVAPRNTESQDPLAAFLKTVLDLSFAMLGNARVTSGRSQSALEVVRQELRIICSLEGRVEDPKLRAAIHERTIDLEFALDAFSALTG
jgi:Bacterial antitoxin of ParD toxin-antitoxin type II system and RHH